jgi:hypothetical protein
MCRYALWSFNNSFSSYNRWSRWLWVKTKKFDFLEKDFCRSILISYFAVSQTGQIECQQTGVFRTNCIDCLDRTNVVQNLFAKRILEKQLQQYNIIKYEETIDSYQQFNKIFKNSKFNSK